MLLNGKPLRIDFERITGYVEQLDVHNGYLTVREALQYSAKLRQEPEVPLEDKLAYVERVLEVSIYLLLPSFFSFFFCFFLFFSFSSSPSNVLRR